MSTIAIHPGVVGTDLVKSLDPADRLLVYATSTVMSPEDGCKESMWGARALRQSVDNDSYYSPIAEPGKQKQMHRGWQLGRKVLEMDGGGSSTLCSLNLSQ